MTTLPDDLGMKPVEHTWYEPSPGTTAHRIRTAVRWTFWATFSALCLAFLLWCDLGAH